MKRGLLLLILGVMYLFLPMGNVGWAEEAKSSESAKDADPQDDGSPG